MKKIPLLIFVNLSFICATSSAVTFSFTGNGNQFAAMDGKAEISGTVDGTELTLKATSALNRSGTPNQFEYIDPNHGFAALLADNLTFTMEFDKAVQIRQFTFENLSGPVTGTLGFELLIGGVIERDVTVPAFPTGWPMVSAVLSTPLTVSANTVVTFQGVVSAGGVYIGMHNMDVNIVPEPASYALGLGLSTVLFIAVRRRRIKKAHAQN